MVKSKGLVLGILALILAIGGLGLGGYSFFNTLLISNQLDKPEFRSRAYLTVSYSISTSTWHTVNFNAMDYNVGGAFNLTTDSFNATYA